MKMSMMLKLSGWSILPIMILLTSCATKKPLFISKTFSDFDRLKIDVVQKFESRNKSENISPKHLITVGESIYPNVNKYQLETPLMFTRKENKHFQLVTDYYYVAADSSVKVIMYQWEDGPAQKNSLPKRENLQEKLSRFQSKFNGLSDMLTKHFGEPLQTNIEHTTVPFGETFRDDSKWKGINGMHAYLFMFGNDKSGYRQIRLALYQK